MSCTFPGCTHVKRSRGLCTKHLQRFRKYGDPSITTMPRFAIPRERRAAERRQEEASQ